jgi:hypothetical protein
MVDCLPVKIRKSWVFLKKKAAVKPAALDKARNSTKQTILNKNKPN